MVLRPRPPIYRWFRLSRLAATTPSGIAGNACTRSARQHRLRVRPAARVTWLAWQRRPRLGEADRPGPDFNVWSINVTSLATSWAELSEGDWDLALIQEANIAGHERVLKAIQDAGVCWLPGPLGPDGRCLVGALARSGGLSQLPRTSTDARAMTISWQPADAPPLVIHNHYGEAEGTASCRLRTAAAVGDSLVDTVGRGDIPCLILGDLNAEALELPVTPALVAAGLLDLSDEATSAPSMRRIDHVYANATARRLLVHHACVWGGFPTHAVQTLRFHYARAQRVCKWVPSRPLPAPASDAPSPSEAWHLVHEELGPSLRRAFASGCPDRAWTWLRAALLAFSAIRAGVDSTPALAPGRGRWQDAARMPATRSSAQAPTVSVLQARKRARRLVCVVSSYGLGPLPSPAAQAAWDAAGRKEPDATWRGLLAAPLTRAWATGLTGRADDALETLLADDRQRRTDSFHQWAGQISTAGSAPVYKWIRNGPSRLRPLPVDPGTRSPGPQGCIEAMDDFWWGLWGRPAADEYHTDRWFGHLWALPRPPPPAPLTAQRLDSALRGWSSRKAPGVDGLRTRDLKDLPLEALTVLADFFTLVEAANRWPAALRDAIVAMLPKKGTAAPSDRRPIVLLTILYRLWAKVRAQEFQDWLVSNHILARGMAASAEVQAADLALILQRARAGGLHVDGLALDWSKCYDHMPLGVVGDALRACGLASSFVSLITDMYSAPRRIVADGLCGHRRVPTHCIPPGCPAATMILSVFTYGWRCEISVVEIRMVSRTYVDDMTASREREAEETARRGQLAICNAQAVSTDFEDAFKLNKNLDKSARFSSDPAVLALLAGSEGETVANTFVDLGADQPACAKPSLVRRTERTAEALQRADRVALLPLPLKWKGIVTAASSVSVGTYAAAVGAIPAHDLALMRRAAFEACWRNRFRVASELAFALHLPWRVDPMAQAIIRPWVYLRSAVARGVCTLEALYTLWETSRDVFVGPIAAAKQSIRLAYLAGGPRQLAPPAQPADAFTPMLCSHHALLHGLLGAFYMGQRTAVAKRRSDLAFWARPVDKWATMRWARLHATENKAAILRNVQTGGAFANDVAQKWTANPACPHCGSADGLLHRFWHCPHWAATRAQVQGDVQGALRRLPPVALTHGVLPLDECHAASCSAAERPRRAPPPTRVVGILWTDGSAIHPGDPLLRRAAWSLAWQDESGAWHSRTGTVPGRQTVGRAELFAAVFAYECERYPEALYIDNQYVAYGIANCRRGRSTKYLDGPDGDLWRRLIAAAPGTDPIWIPSHMELHEALARGYTELAWLGNRKADQAANEATVALRPAAAEVGRRVTALDDLAVAQQVIVAVQRAILEAAHGARPTVRRRAGRAKTVRMTIFARLRAKRVVRIRRSRPDWRPPTITSAPAVHDLRPVAGPVPPTAHGLSTSHWKVACITCGQTCMGTGRWTAFAKTRCPGPQGQAPLPPLHLTRQNHHLDRVGDAFACRWCGRGVPSVQRARAAASACPVPRAEDTAGALVPDAMRALRHGVFLAQAWRGHNCGKGRCARRVLREVLPPVPEPVAPIAPPRPAALRWVPHLPVRDARAQWCLLCSCRTTARLQALEASSCPGPAAPSAELLLRLRARAFDASLAVASEAVVARARAMGWEPCGPPRPPPPRSTQPKRALPAGGPLGALFRRQRTGPPEAVPASASACRDAPPAFMGPLARPPARPPQPRGTKRAPTVPTGQLHLRAFGIGCPGPPWTAPLARPRASASPGGPPTVADARPVGPVPSGTQPLLPPTGPAVPAGAPLAPPSQLHLRACGNGCPGPPRFAPYARPRAPAFPGGPPSGAGSCSVGPVPSGTQPLLPPAGPAVPAITPHPAAPPRPP